MTGPTPMPVHHSRATMTVIKISWYLCFLFVLALAVESTITVAPAGATVIRFLMWAWAILAILFAAVAISFKVFRFPEPKWLLRSFQAVAVVATVAVVLMVVG